MNYSTLEPRGADPGSRPAADALRGARDRHAGPCLAAGRAHALRGEPPAEAARVAVRTAALPQGGPPPGAERRGRTGARRRAAGCWPSTTSSSRGCATTWPGRRCASASPRTSPSAGSPRRWPASPGRIRGPSSRCGWSGTWSSRSSSRAAALDLAVTFDPEPGRPDPEEVQLPVRWLAAPGFRWQAGTPLPLVLFEPPCTFRRLALEALDRAGIPWRVAFTSPSLSGLWAAAAAGLGVTVRTELGHAGRGCGGSWIGGCPRFPALAFRVEGARGGARAAGRSPGGAGATSSGAPPPERGPLRASRSSVPAALSRARPGSPRPAPRPGRRPPSACWKKRRTVSSTCSGWTSWFTSARNAAAPRSPCAYQARCLRKLRTAAAGVADEGHVRPEVPEHHLAPLVAVRGRPALELAEDPRVAERAAADHHQVAAGGLAHPHRVGRGLHVAVADERHRPDVLPQIGDHRPVRLAGVALGAGARVHRQARRSRRPRAPRPSPGSSGAARPSRCGSSP